MFYQDGQVYENRQDIPDLGGWECISVNGNKRNYQGKSTEVDKLPNYVAGGSTARCIDNGDYYIFYKTSKTWYKA